MGVYFFFHHCHHVECVPHRVETNDLWQLFKTCSEIIAKIKLTLMLCILGNFSGFSFHLLTFSKNSFSNTKSVCQMVWIQIMNDILFVLIWVQTICKGYQTTKVKELK